MRTLLNGTAYPGLISPLYSVGEEGAGGAGSQEQGGNGGEQGGNGAFVFDAGKAFEGLEADNLEWLQKNETLLKDPKALARHTFNQEKLLGNAIRIPKEDATPEEREAFLNKLGRPEKPDGYQLKAPEKMPEGMAYDGEFASAFKAEAHKLGLTAAQAAGLHDLYVNRMIEGYGAGEQKTLETIKAKADGATAELTKLWGPLDGQTAKTNFEFANRVFTLAPGGNELLEELKGLGLVGPNKEVLSRPLATVLAAVGGALYAEDNVLRGDAARVANPFRDGETFNLTEAMKVVKENPDEARSLIAAAGKKPEDFGLK